MFSQELERAQLEVSKLRRPDGALYLDCFEARDLMSFLARAQIQVENLEVKLSTQALTPCDALSVMAGGVNEQTRYDNTNVVPLFPTLEHRMKG